MRNGGGGGGDDDDDDDDDDLVVVVVGFLPSSRKLWIFQWTVLPWVDQLVLMVTPY